MTIEQTVEIPVSHRLVIDVPPEVPVGRTVLAFTPAEEAVKWATAQAEPTAEELEAATAALATGEPCPICAKYTDPETGELCFNAETIVAFEEGDAILRR